LAGKDLNKKELRRQRRQREKTQRERAALRKRAMIWGGGVFVTILIGVVLFQQLNPANQVGTVVLDQGNQHIGSVDEPHVPYNTTPPTSGPHMSGLWQWGISEEPIADEWQVHNLEDGGVIIQYDCPDDSCPDLKAELTDFVTQLLADSSLRNPNSGTVHLILAPYSGFRNTPASSGQRIALTAWTRILYLDTVDRQKMMEFIRAYLNDDHHARGAG